MKDLLALLNAFDDREENDSVLFRNLLAQCLEEALPELGQRLVRPTTSWALKRLILTSPGRFPHPGWTPVLQRCLMHETHEDLFEDACRALVQMGGESETDALRQVAFQRQEPVLQAIVSRKLAFLEPRQPFSFHFRDMQLGGKNVRLSNQAAEHLALNAKVEHLPDLMAASDHPDHTASLHAIRVISSIQHRTAGRFLMERFEAASDALLLDNWFRSAQEQIKRAPAQSVKTVVLELLRTCPELPSHEPLLLTIDAMLEDPNGDALPVVQQLRGHIQGLKETRLVDCLADLAIGHSVRLANLMPEPLEEQRQRTLRLQGAMDACAEGLTRFARRGILDKQDILPLFKKAYVGGAGGDDFGRSFAEILDDDDDALRELILASTNHRWREEGLTVLGERLRPNLLHFFLRAMADPIVDVAQLAIRYFGRLPGSFDLAMALFHSGKADQMERALEIFSLNGMTEAGPALMEHLDKTEREDTLLAMIRCLGALAYQPAVDSLLDLLRGGQSPRVQRAAAESLMGMDSVEAVKGLLHRALGVRNPEIQLLAIEAINRIRCDFQHGMQPDECQLVEQLLEACFDEGPVYRLRAIVAAQGIWTLDQFWFEKVEARISAVVAEQRKRSTWDRDQQQAVALAMREMDRKRRELGLLISSGNPIRELISGYVPRDGGGAQTFQALLMALETPGLVLAIEVRAELEALIGMELQRPGADELSLEAGCRMAGRIQATDNLDALLELLRRSSPQSTLRKTCLEVLRGMGCPESRLEWSWHPLEVLVLEPSAFFRKRIVGVLPQVTLREAQDREDAEKQLKVRPADLLISETADHLGDLSEWFAVQWRWKRVRQVVLSTSSRSTANLQNRPWIAGSLLKPYPMEDLIALIGP